MTQADEKKKSFTMIEKKFSRQKLTTRGDVDAKRLRFLFFYIKYRFDQSFFKQSNSGNMKCFPSF